jgi:hypothetical protein
MSRAKFGRRAHRKVEALANALREGVTKSPVAVAASKEPEAPGFMLSEPYYPTATATP